MSATKNLEAARRKCLHKLRDISGILSLFNVDVSRCYVAVEPDVAQILVFVGNSIYINDDGTPATETQEMTAYGLGIAVRSDGASGAIVILPVGERYHARLHKELRAVAEALTLDRVSESTI